MVLRFIIVSKIAKADRHESSPIVERILMEKLYMSIHRGVSKTEKLY